MRFIKDILLFDVETSGPDVDRDVMVQFGAVLLDKDNLLEKALFNSYIRNSLLQETLAEQAKNAHTNLGLLQTAPKPLDFLKAFQEQFAGEFTFAVPGPNRLFFLRQAFRKQNIAFPYELQSLDLWTLYYVYSVRMGLKKIPNLQTMAEHFHLKLQNPYDAFERARLQVTIFKQVCQEL
jgi:DNA polymerase III alpha subunit (gram-positive type)